jgi:hypothetical protein
MRLIQGNKVFAEWWNTWMSRLHSAHTTTLADVPCEAPTEREHWQERDKNSDPPKTASWEPLLLDEFPLRKGPY